MDFLLDLKRKKFEFHVAPRLIIAVLVILGSAQPVGYLLRFLASLR